MVALFKVILGIAMIVGTPTLQRALQRLRNEAWPYNAKGDFDACLHD